MVQESADMQKKECTMCKFTLVFAVVVALLVMAFTFFFKLNIGTKTFVPEKTATLPAAEIDARLIMLASSTAFLVASTNVEVAVDQQSIGQTLDYPFLTYWQYPLITERYMLDDKIFVRGQYQLPPDWAGSITVLVDGEAVSEKIMLSNIGRDTDSTGTFAGLISKELPEGEHDIRLVVDVAARCAIAGKCPRDNMHVRLGLEYPSRTVVVGLPKISVPAKTQ